MRDCSPRMPRRTWPLSTFAICQAWVSRGCFAPARPRRKETEMPLPALLLARLRAFPAVLRQRAGEIQRSLWTQRSKAGEFALVEHACHLRDFEIDGCHVRMQAMLAEDVPTLV